MKYAEEIDRLRNRVRDEFFPDLSGNSAFALHSRAQIDIFRHNLNIFVMDINSSKQTLAEYLKEKKLRSTRERFVLLEEIMKTNKHFDADELYATLLAKGLKASRATVYNTLDLLVECGIISKYHFGEGHNRYERALGRPRHDHLICLECGDIAEFVSEKLTRIQKEVCEDKKFMMQNATLQIFGTCAKCQAKKKN